MQDPPQGRKWLLWPAKGTRNGLREAAGISLGRGPQLQPERERAVVTDSRFRAGRLTT